MIAFRNVVVCTGIQDYTHAKTHLHMPESDIFNTTVAYSSFKIINAMCVLHIRSDIISICSIFHLTEIFNVRGIICYTTDILNLCKILSLLHTISHVSFVRTA